MGVGGVGLAVLLAIGLQAATSRAQDVTWYVDRNCSLCGEGTLAGPFRTIKEAVAAADNGDTILVAEGTYVENLTIDSRLTVLGGYRAVAPDWVRDIAQYETIISSGDRTVPGDWDGDWLGSFAVARDDYAYRMWYSAGSEMGGDHIGYADSPDGVNWFRPYSTPLLSPGGPSAWDGSGVMDPTVLLSGGLRMWYAGLDASGHRAIGCASSLDGFVWRKCTGNPVLEPDSGDADSFGFPTVLQEGPSDYRMWYSGGGSIWHATSSDGVNWDKHLGNAALSPGPAGAWDDERVYAPRVVRSLARYEMWYVGEGTTASGPQIGYAWSSDGLVWTKAADNPALGAHAGYWEEGAVAYPAVTAAGAADYTMWYLGGDEGSYAIGRATSTDGSRWARYEDNPVLVQGNPTHWGPAVVSFGSSSGGAILEGFTVRDGYSAYGGGIYAYEASPIIRSCRITDNVAHNAGGGIWVGNGAPTIEDTVLSGNHSLYWGGGIAVSTASPDIRNSTVAGNTALDCGGGILAVGGSGVRIVGTEVAENTARCGGGLYAGDGAEVMVSSSRVIGNIAQEGGGMRFAYATAIVTNTFVVNNVATSGVPGGLEFRHAAGRLVNVTVADNTATGGTGGIVFRTDDPADQLVILNSILFFNGADDLDCAGGPCLVTYSDLPASFAGVGNISADPRFVDRSAGDYHLRSDSPAIDVGTSEGAPDVDFEGDPRPAGQVDMGADEY